MRKGAITPSNLNRVKSRHGALWGRVALLLTLLCASVVQAQPLPREGGAKESPAGTVPAAPKGAPGSAGPVGVPGSAGPSGPAGPAGLAGLAGLAAPSGPSTFSLAGAPAGAEVAIDGTVVGVTPLGPRTPVSPGPHQLKVTRRGYSSYTRDFVAYAGRMVLLEIDLVPAYMVVRVRTGDAAAQVLVDEELRGETPIELELRPGPHQILVRRANFLDQSWPLTAVAGQEVERDVLLEEKPEQRRKEKEALPKERRFYTRWWVWTLAAVGAVGIASAIIIPTVLGQRSDCDKLGGEVCFPIQLGTPTMTTPALTVRF